MCGVVGARVYTSHPLTINIPSDVAVCSLMWPVQDKIAAISPQPNLGETCGTHTAGSCTVVASLANSVRNCHLLYKTSRATTRRLPRKNDRKKNVVSNG